MLAHGSPQATPQLTADVTKERLANDPAKSSSRFWPGWSHETTMKRSCLVILLLLVLLISLRPAIAQQTSREDEVRAAVSAFGRAFVQADVPLLQAYLTDDYLHINGRTGKVLNRTKWLKWVESRKAELRSGDLVVNAYRIEDVKVEVYEEAAVVTGVVDSSGQRKGTSFTSRVRFTNVWVMQGGAWRRAAFHDSPLPETGTLGEPPAGQGGR